MKRLLPAMLIAISTFSYAQEQNTAPPPPPSESQQQQQDQQAGGGWPDAGTVPNQAPEAQQAPAPNRPQQPPYASQPPNANQAPYPNQPYPNQGPYSNQPNGQYGPQGGQYGPPPGGQYGQPGNQQPVPAQLTVAPGTFLSVRINQKLASDKNQVGDPFTATLEQPLVVNGVVVAEPGQSIGGQVVESRKVDGVSHLGIRLTDLTLVDGQTVPIQTQLIARQANRLQGRDAGPIVGTTALGAAIGGAVGWGQGAAIGAGAGALISLGAVLAHGHASVIYPEQPLTFRLEAPVQITTVNAPQAFRYVQPGEYDRPPSGPAYATVAPPPAPYPYYGAYGSPYPYAYPYYWGPSVGLYFGPSYYRGWYGRPYYGGHYYYGGRGYYRR